MKTKYLFLAALAGMTLVGCTSDDFIAEAPPVDNNEAMTPIVFSSLKSNFTRADFEGAKAADMLGNKFVVTGFKGEQTAQPGSIVFDNYLVEYKENSANTTESNSSNWEYVGKGLIPHATTNGITQQAIKYWDYSQPQYDFFAWSTGKKEAVYADDKLAAGKVLVSNITPNSKTTSWATGTPERAAYTFTGSAADLSQVYISDIVTVKKGGAEAADKYGVAAYGYNNPVTLRFRQLGTKVRIGIYETVPGYSVKDVQFYNAANVALVKEGDAIPNSDPAATYNADGAAKANASAKIFTTVANGIFQEGTYTVYFPTVDESGNADNNQAHIKFAEKTNATQSTTVDWGALNYTYRESGESSDKAEYLGRTSKTASFAGDADANYYVVYLPNQEGTNLNLRVNYTLESIDGSKETILVQGATAQVPSIYTAWKPGYAYTYLFKISDKTNGYTGVYDPTKPDDTTVNSDPAGLYPITFDALVVNAEEDATQETITTIASPSITSYQKGSKVVNNNEYLAATGDIFVTVNDGSKYEVAQVAEGESVAIYYTKVGNDYVPCAAEDVAVAGTTYYKLLSPNLSEGALVTLTGKAALYTVAEGTTEAEVVDALQMQDDDFEDATEVVGRSGLKLTKAKAVTNAAAIADENDYALTNSVEFGADGNAIAVATDQALRFKPAAATTYAFVYTKTAATNTVDKYQALNWDNFEQDQTKYRYDLSQCTAGDAQKDVEYYIKSTSGTTITYAKKTAFIGQRVDNLYIKDNNGDYVAASGYAQTSVSYYHGDNHAPVETVKYEDFGSAIDIYTFDGTTYTQKPTEATPVDGVAYYKQVVDTNDPSKFVYVYCIILPEQATTYWYQLDTAKYGTADETTAITGMTYFDKYTKNNGEYYTKVIKVQ